jgi:UPF0176 protein
MNYLVLAYYSFQKIENPHQEVLDHKAFLEKCDATCRIYISEEGINGQLSCERQDACRYMDWMHSRPEFADLSFRLHAWHEQAFPRLTIKYRKKLVARERTVDLKKTGEHLAPQRWQEMLEKEKDILLLDVRNSYEWEVGRFHGAELPLCETFRDFEKYADALKEKYNPKTQKVMMYCTGGIRCEIYSAYLKEQGFENVYQLKGGIIQYGLEQGSKHWEGKLFVFDDRLTVPISPEPSPVIGKCSHCQSPIENYYNCANMDCNALFLCCPDCLHTYLGCCQGSCKEAPRLRPYQQQNPHKPFRRAHELIS